MKIYHLRQEQFIPTTLETAWQFFSSPHNLSKITPPNLDFVVTSTSLPAEIYKGMRIHYYVRPLFGIRVKWETEITEVKKPHSFTDTQAKGPYRLWEHHHEFIEKDGGVLALDHVRYALPFGVLGSIAQKLLVQQRLKHIFDFRRQTLEKLFTPHPR